MKNNTKEDLAEKYETVVNTEIADCYQSLFNHLSKEYNLTLTISEMDEIIRHSLKTIDSKDKKLKQIEAAIGRRTTPFGNYKSDLL